jgi:hypothetical protein
MKMIKVKFLATSIKGKDRTIGEKHAQSLEKKGIVKIVTKASKDEK